MLLAIALPAFMKTRNKFTSSTDVKNCSQISSCLCSAVLGSASERFNLSCRSRFSLGLNSMLTLLALLVAQGPILPGSGNLLSCGPSGPRVWSGQTVFTPYKRKKTDKV